MIVSPEIDAVTPPSIWNTRLALLPLTVTPAAGPVIVSVPVVSLSSSWVPFRVIVCGVAKTVVSKSIVLAPPVEFAWPIASRRSSGQTAVVGRAVHGERGQQRRSSSASKVGRIRRAPFRASTVPRPLLR